jgi:hypothetical protein
MEKHAGIVVSKTYRGHFTRTGVRNKIWQRDSVYQKKVKVMLEFQIGGFSGRAF